jgi:hypothetical protein
MQTEPIVSFDFDRKRQLAVLADTVDSEAELPVWAEQAISEAQVAYDAHVPAAASTRSVETRWGLRNERGEFAFEGGSDTTTHREWSASKSAVVKDRNDDWPGDPAVGDTKLKALAHEIGADGLPQVVSAAALDKYIAGGETEVFRGTTDGYANQLRTGEAHFGFGTYGNGIYVTMGPDARAAADQYAVTKPRQDETSVTVRMSLKADAKVIPANQLEVAMRAFAMSHPSEDERHLFYGHRALGRFALAQGYDAIRVASPNLQPRNASYLVVVNRTALRVQDTNLEPFDYIPND